MARKAERMSALVVDAPGDEAAPAWWFLDTLVVEHRGAPGMTTVVMEMTLPAGSSAPLHVHHDLDDTWYVLDGTMVVRCGDDSFVVGPGHWVSMPRGVPHTFRVLDDGDARILMVHDNATFRDLIREVGVEAETRSLPLRPVFPNPDELTRVAAGHDLTPVGPPMTSDDSAAVLAGTP
jgi:mannose-6-phosphate isomerase-like protein (cupin superfamily)